MKVIMMTEDEFRSIVREELMQLQIEKKQENLPRKYLSVKELSAYIHLSIPAIYQRVAEGSIPHKRAGARILFEVSDIDQWLEDRNAQLFAHK